MQDDEREREKEPPGSAQGNDAVADSAGSKEEKDGAIHLQWRDWVALTLASLETILLPAVAIIVVLIALIMAFRFFG